MIYFQSQLSTIAPHLLLLVLLLLIMSLNSPSLAVCPVRFPHLHAFRLPPFPAVWPLSCDRHFPNLQQFILTGCPYLQWCDRPCRDSDFIIFSSASQLFIIQTHHPIASSGSCQTSPTSSGVSWGMGESRYGRCTVPPLCPAASV